MATNLSVTVSVLVVLFSISYARYTADLPDAVTLTNVPEAAESQKLVESLHKLDSDIQLKPAEKDHQPEGRDQSGEKEKKESQKPLTVISFRPINRQFPRHPLTSLRPGHKCRHLFWRGVQMRNLWGSRFKGRDLPYPPKDVTLPSKRDDRTFDGVSRGVGGVREVPSRWAKFRYGRPRFATMRDDAEIMKPTNKHHHSHSHRHRHEGEERKHEHEHDHQHKHKHKHEGGFMKRIRKFLNHHF